MSIAADLKQIAIEQIDDFGTDIIINAIASSYSTASGANTKTPTPVTQKAIIENYKANELGNLVAVGDIKVTIADKGTEPAITGQVEIDSLTHDIINVEKIVAQGVTVMYVMQARK